MTGYEEFQKIMSEINYEKQLMEDSSYLPPEFNSIFGSIFNK